MSWKSSDEAFEFLLVCGIRPNLRYCSHFYSACQLWQRLIMRLPAGIFCASFREHAFAIKCNRHVLAQNYTKTDDAFFVAEPLIQSHSFDSSHYMQHYTSGYVIAIVTFHSKLCGLICVLWALQLYLIFHIVFHFDRETDCVQWNHGKRPWCRKDKIKWAINQIDDYSGRN